MRAYKVTDQNMQCRGFQYELGKQYTHEGNIKICGSGFHACLRMADCFNYYSFDSSNRVFEVEVGNFIEDGDKICTDKIEFIKEFTWHEVLNLCNSGKDNTGLNNTGDWNTGYSNTGNRNTGIFCTGEKTLKLFNKESDWTEEMFFNSSLYSKLCQIDTKMWVDESIMNDSEKASFPSYKTSGGYLKDIPYKEAFQSAWVNWDKQSRQIFLDLPNFDKDIFFEITGVKID